MKIERGTRVRRGYAWEWIGREREIGFARCKIAGDRERKLRGGASRKKMEVKKERSR